MKSIFLLIYGWTDTQGPELTETHSSIEGAEETGERFLAAERRFAAINHGAPAYYRIERYSFDVVISEVKL